MLKAVLILNALSCAIFGALFFLKSEEVANFIGTPPALFVQVLGAGLFINAILLIFTGLQSSPKRKDVLFFSLGDAAWVAFTAILLIGNIWIINSEAIYWSVAVALFVGLCGVLQWIFAPKAEQPSLELT
ncbi:MAG: hypothetical protein DHS20C07_23890 [Methyloligella sp.]|nr:MAG: hypothetical protein DHS20C07_23890 [Methyloligella sp.]